MKTETFQQITDITSKLISVSLSQEQNFPSERDGVIYVAGQHDLSVALKNISYSEIYESLESARNYNIKMVDGALIQLMYQFADENTLIKHRLAFFPSPSLEEFQNNSEVYELDEIYADVISKNIVPSPIRFDYDPDNFIEISHPKAHLTIGQYKNCRIPTMAPLTPILFIEFILRSFYNTATLKYTDTLAFSSSARFDDCIHEKERECMHIAFGIKSL